MARKARIHIDGGLYHVMLRGNAGDEYRSTMADVAPAFINGNSYLNNSSQANIEANARFFGALGFACYKNNICKNIANKVIEKASKNLGNIITAELIIKVFQKVGDLLKNETKKEQAENKEKQNSATTPASPDPDDEGDDDNNKIPNKAKNTLKDIKKNNGKAPKGYEGGKTFKNKEQLLPKKDVSGNPITYKEYDVNPSQKGVDRGTQRLVIGSDGKAYYTIDHYKTFIPVE